MSPAPLLAVEELVIRHGGVVAVDGVSLRVGEGEVVAVVGPNGAGKTSLLSAVAGALRPASGRVAWRGEALTREDADGMAARGLALVPEGREIFATLTVEENLVLGATLRRDRAAVRDDLDRLTAEFPILGERRRQPAGRLSGGEQQMLAIARALMGCPKLLMLDEPSLGLAPKIVDRVYAALARLRDGGLSLLVVEQSARRALAIADRIYVMNGGRMRFEGTRDAAAEHPEFDAAYFGAPVGAGAA